MLTTRARKSEYLKAGVTLAAGLLILGAFMVVLGGNWFWVKYDSFSILFPSVKDLSTGRPVKYAGLDVGRVHSIVIDPDNPRYIQVRIDVRHTFPIYRGTMARIAQKGLVGDHYVLLELRGEPGPRLVGGETIAAITTMDMQDVISKAGELLDDIRPKISEIADNIDKLFSDTNTESLRKALEGAPLLVADLQGAAKDFRTNWESLTTKTGRAAETLDASLKRVDKAVGQVESELKKTLETYRAAGKNADGLVTDVRQGLNYDQEQLEMLLGNLNKTSREVKELARHLRERPWEVLRSPSESTK
jgi:phospholipid/cholesterol/gamma-HCH transport system substrate-binding protein